MSAEHVTVRAAESAASRRERIAGGAVTRTRVAAAFGLLSVFTIFAGFFIHSYPAIGASGKEIVHWATITNQRQFAIGIYIEHLGFLLLLLFAAWLWTVARDAEGGSGWLSTAGFGAAVLYVGAGLVSNGVWWAVLDGGRHGTSPQTLTTIRDIAQHIYDLSLLLPAAFLILTGYVLFRTRALPRLIGGAAVPIGVSILIPPIANGMHTFFFLWMVAVSLYLLVRPGAVATVSEPLTAVPSPAAGVES
jgi:hypothetical protein